MTAIALDTHQAVRRLEAAGADRDALVTTADLAELRADLTDSKCACTAPCGFRVGPSYRHPHHASVPAAPTMRPECDFSRGKRGVTAGERPRWPVRVAEGCTGRSVRVSATRLNPEAATTPKWEFGGGSPP